MLPKQLPLNLRISVPSCLQMVVPGPGEHPLQYNYTFWYSRRTPGRPASTQSYEQNIKQIGSFASVCSFSWMWYYVATTPLAFSLLVQLHVDSLSLRRWSSSGVFTVIWSARVTWQVIVTSISSKRALSPCGRSVFGLWNKLCTTLIRNDNFRT